MTLETKMHFWLVKTKRRLIRTFEYQPVAHVCMLRYHLMLPRMKMRIHHEDNVFSLEYVTCCPWTGH